MKQLFEMSTFNSKTLLQPLAKCSFCLINGSLRQLVPNVLQHCLQLIDMCRLWIQTIVFGHHSSSNMVIQWVQIERIWGPLILVYEIRTIYQQDVLSVFCSVCRCHILLKYEDIEACLNNLPAIQEEDCWKLLEEVVCLQ